MITITLPMPPSANTYWTFFRGYVQPSRAAVKYKENVGKLALVAGIRPITGPVALTLKVYLSHPKSDLSNRIKILEDALQKFAYHDDHQVVRILAERVNSPNQRVEVTVAPA